MDAAVNARRCGGNWLDGTSCGACPRCAETAGAAIAGLVQERDAAVRALQIPRPKREPDIVVELPGHPRGKGHGSAVNLPGFNRPVILQDSKTRTYQAMVKFAGEQAMAGRPLFDCALRCRVTAVFDVPKSKPKKFRREALGWIVRPTTKPDDDNLLKVRDALKGVVFRDDCLFVESTVRKFYGEKPFWRFEAWVHTSLLL